MSIQNWYYGRNFPEISRFDILCDCLKCDSDYLLGRIYESKHTFESMTKETGLTEQSLKALMEYHKSINQTMPQNTIFGKEHIQSLQLLQMTLNSLIPSKSGNKLLNAIGHYLYGGNGYLYYNKQPITDRLEMHFPDTNESYSVPIEEFSSILLSNITQQLAAMKGDVL